MRHSLIAIALTLVFHSPLASEYQPHAIPEGKSSGVDSEQLYVVTLDDAPLVTFRGSSKARDLDGRLLAATAPAASGKLDVKSKASLGYLAYLSRRHRSFLDTAHAKLGRTLAPRFRYAYVDNGMAIRLTADEAQALRRMPGVVAVRPDRHDELTTDTGPGWIGADQVWRADLAGPLANRGEGVVVAVLDTGINEFHQSFADIGGDGFDHTNARGQRYGFCRDDASRCNDKLIGIYDFTDEGERRGVDSHFHGSHVASIAVGNVSTAAITTFDAPLVAPVSGVAPHANLITYKVCKALCSRAAQIAAIDQAVADQVDVINRSIAGSGNPWLGVDDPSQSVSVDAALLNARAAGIVSVAGAGNRGSVPGAVGNVAPWIITVGSTTHSRVYRATLSDVTGTGIAAPLSFVGRGTGAAVGKTRVVHGRQFGFPTCARDIGTNPFGPGTFQGQIVVCDQSDVGAAKLAAFLRIGGASGMILANTAADGEVVADRVLELPAVHLGFGAADQLRQLLDAPDANVSGAITATQRTSEPAVADMLARSSSVGANREFAGWLKPNLSAPGVNIMGAISGNSAYQFVSGTSMATPHVAGVAALLLGAHPSWTPSHVESALLTTTRAGVRASDGSPATAHETGAGRVDAAAAVRAGLYLAVSHADFVAADPAAGGHPETLNQPYVAGDCFERCTFRRTVTDLTGGGTWRVEVSGAAAGRVAVSPGTFTLAAGASQELTFSADVTDPDVIGQHVYGDVTLVNTSNASVPSTRLPVALFADPGAVPEELVLALPSNTGSGTLSLSGLVALPGLRVHASALGRALDESFSIAEGAQVAPTLDIPPSTSVSRVEVRTTTTTSQDVDLYVVLDANGNAFPDTGEPLLCSDALGDANTYCTFDLPASGAAQRIVLIVRNFTAGQPGVPDMVDVFAVATPAEGDGTLTATGPGHTGRLEAFDLRFAVDAPRMQSGDVWIGFVDAFATETSTSPFAQLRVRVTSSNTNGPGARVLSAVRQPGFAPEDTLDLDLAPGTAHERIVIDVPSNATGLTLSTTGTGQVDLYAAKAPAGDATSSLVPPAPARSQAQARSTATGAFENIELRAPTLTPGRWYVTPVNTGTTRASITLAVDVESAGNAPPMRANGYFNPSRSGHGVLLSEGGDQRVLIWYTYLPDGTPTWYLAQGPKPSATDGAWQAPLYRFTWDGAASHGTIVGEAMLTPSAANAFTFSWLVDGQYGSEPMIELAPRACPSVNGTPTEYSGTWFAPQTPGYGFSVLTYASTEVQVAYLYDAQGVPRWLYGQNAPFGSGNFTLSQFTGFCPSCAATNVSARSAGTLVRTLADPASGTTAVSGTFQAPVSGTWSTSQATSKLTDNLGCN